MFTFNLQRRKILMAQEAYLHMHNECVAVKTRNIPYLEAVALCARMQTSLHPGPVLRINCPFPSKPF
jgi:hypothetical protein